MNQALAKAIRKAQAEKWEAGFLLQLRAAGLPLPEREFRFHPLRRWRFDFCYPAIQLAIELEGGIWSAGRHVRPKGFEQDAEKYNAAALMGYTVLRFTERMIQDGSAIRDVERGLAQLGDRLDAPAAGGLE